MRSSANKNIVILKSKYSPDELTNCYEIIIIKLSGVGNCSWLVSIFVLLGVVMRNIILPFSISTMLLGFQNTPSFICIFPSSLKERDIENNTFNSYANKLGGILKSSANRFVLSLF